MSLGSLWDKEKTGAVLSLAETYGIRETTEIIINHISHNKLNRRII